MNDIDTRVQKWGNSLALRIPKAYARQMGLHPNCTVTLSLDGTRLIVEAASHPDLDELLAGITPDNRHDEIDTGAPAGNEAW